MEHAWLSVLFLVTLWVPGGFYFPGEYIPLISLSILLYIHAQGTATISGVYAARRGIHAPNGVPPKSQLFIIVRGCGRPLYEG